MRTLTLVGLYGWVLWSRVVYLSFRWLPYMFAEFSLAVVCFPSRRILTVGVSRLKICVRYSHAAFVPLLYSVVGCHLVYDAPCWGTGSLTGSPLPCSNCKYWRRLCSLSGSSDLLQHWLVVWANCALSQIYHLCHLFIWNSWLHDWIITKW